MFNNKIIIEFEGLGGVGKTTQINKLNTFLKSANIKSRVYKPSNDLEVVKAEDSRIKIFDEISKNAPNESLTRQLKSLIVSYDQVTKVFETLSKDADAEVIIMDRYKYTFYLGKALFDWGIYEYYINSMIEWLLEADIGFLFKLSVEDALKRIESRGEPLRVYDNIEKFTAIDDCYSTLFEQYQKSNFYIIDAKDSVDTIHSFIVDKVMAAIKRAGYIK